MQNVSRDLPAYNSILWRLIQVLPSTLRLDDNISKDRTYEIAQKFIKWKRIKNRKYQYLRKYNITIEDFSKLKKAQNNSCAICNKLFTNTKKTHIDHCHFTLKVRGILCSNCNLGLGNFKDNIESLINAVKYLKKNEEL